jgi:hypothetical protein
VAEADDGLDEKGARRLKPRRALLLKGNVECKAGISIRS